MKCTHGFIQRVFDVREIAHHRVLGNSRGELMNCLPGLTLHLGLEFKAFSDYEPAGSNWFFMKSVISSIVRSLMSFGGGCVK